MTMAVKPPSDEAALRSAAVASPCARSAEPWVLLATILGSSLAFIDGTVVTVALPTIQRELHASVANVQWVVEAYSLFLAALILVGGALGDRLGRRRVFVAGIMLFTCASVVCGFAPTILILIVARAVQGVGGALLVPGSLAILSAAFDEQRRGRAIGTWSGFTAITSAVGPVLGGWLVTNASWRWVFWLNVPIAALTLAVTYWRVPESTGPAQAGRLDWRGAVLATLGLGGIVFGLIESSALGLSAPVVLVALAGGAVALAAFFMVERHTERVGGGPMVPLSLFRSRTFSGANLLTLLLYGGLGGAMYFLPFNLQQVQGYTATEAGASLLPMTVIIFSLSRWSGGLVARYGAKVPLIVGPLIAAAGFALFALPGIHGSYWTTYFPATVVLSLGMALVIAPLTTSVMNAVNVQRSGVASGINNAVSRAAGLITIAVLNLVVLAVFNGAFDGSLATLHLAPSVQQMLDAQRGRLAGAQPPPGVSAATAAAIQRAIGLAFVAGFRVAMLFSAGLAVASAIAAAFLIEGQGFGQLLREARARHAGTHVLRSR